MCLYSALTHLPLSLLLLLVTIDDLISAYALRVRPYKMEEEYWPGAHRVSPDIRYDRLSTHRPYSLLLIVLLQNVCASQSSGCLWLLNHSSWMDWTGSEPATES
jgi:hypothetical protein